MDHSQLVQIGYDALVQAGCGSAIIREPRLKGEGELPDLLGFRDPWCSILFECKASRADFLADANKPFRQNGSGCGNLRLFIANPGVIDHSELGYKWGLVVVNEIDGEVHTLEEVEAQHQPANTARERVLLAWHLRGLSAPARQTPAEAQGWIQEAAGHVRTGGPCFASEAVLAVGRQSGESVSKSADRLAEAVRRGRVPGVGCEIRQARPWIFPIGD
jgi:hypothetical protein